MDNLYSVSVPCSQMCNQTMCLHRSALGYCLTEGCVNRSKFEYAVTATNRSIPITKPKEFVCPHCGETFTVD